MVNKQTIKIINRSGSQQRYVLFNKAPQIIGRVQGKIWSNVFATARTADTQHANFSIFEQYYGVVGTSDGSPDQGVEVDVGGSKAVTLGSTKPDGTLVPGTTLQLLVKDQAPQFGPPPAPSSFPKAFEIRTSNDFTVAEAKRRNYMIGLGGSRTGTSLTGPAATFMPEPSVKYQIQPVNVFYVTHGDYSKGSLIDVTKTGTNTVTINFAELEKDDVVVVHDDHGNFNIQA